MDKEEARYLIKLHHDKILEGELRFPFNEVEYVFTDSASNLSRIQLAKQVSLIKGLDDVTFKDETGIHTLSISDFDELCSIMILIGNDYWEEKIERYSLLEDAVTSEEIEAIVNKVW